MSNLNDLVIKIQPASPPINNTVDITDHSKTPDNQFEIPQTHQTSALGVPNRKISTTSVQTEPKRRVSIASDPISEQVGRHGYDNLAYEKNPSRKISQTSMHGEVGPVRRKSILVNSGHDNESIYSHNSQHSTGKDIDSVFIDNRPNGGKTLNTQSALDVLNSKLNEEQTSTNFIEKSWIYLLCLRCHSKENQPAWEPPHWQKICPYPLCPSFRQFSRIISLISIGVLIWITAYVIIGDSAAPGGQLFGLVVLTVAANFGGFLVSLTTLPRLIGMLIVGVLFQNVGWVDLDGDFRVVTGELRKFALTLILIRAGLEMEPKAFKKVYKTILKLGIVPWLSEAVAMAVMSHFFLDLPWIWGFLLGVIIAAVSPAVVVPCLYRLRTRGYGVAKGIPTLVIAVAGIDDALSVASFGIIASIMFHADNLSYQISQAPVCIIGGLAFGVIWGYFARIFPEKGDPYVIPLRTIMLFAGGLVAIFGSDLLGYEGAGPLGVVFAAFISNKFWCEQGWDIEDNPVGIAFEIFWMIFEPILFGITGATIKINELEPQLVGVGLGCIVVGCIIRIICTAGVAFGDHLNLKEKIFVAICWMSKATVQAALGPVALRYLSDKATPEQRRYGEIVQTVSILGICLTAPLGAILISITGNKMLTKTRQPHVTEGWRRSHRPSIRDISIIDEVEEREDPEDPKEAKDKETATNTISPIPNNSQQTFTYNN